jgi:hypothetical protein
MEGVVFNAKSCIHLNFSIKSYDRFSEDRTEVKKMRKN